MITSIVQWLLWLISSIGYGWVGLAMFIESFFAPIPSELIMPFAWFLAAQGEMNLVVVILIWGICSYLGTLPFYFIWYRWHRAKVHSFIEKYWKYLFIKPEEVKRGFDLFEKYGKTFVFVGRLIPIVRTLVSFPAWSVRMNFLVFTLLTLAGALIRSALLCTAGYLLGKNREVVGQFMDTYQNIFIAIFALLLWAWIILKIWNHYKIKKTNK